MRILISSKRLFITVLLIVSLGAKGLTQIAEKALPFSLNNTNTKSLAEIPSFKALPIDIEALLTEDIQNPSLARYSVFEDVRINIKEAGLRTELPGEEGTLWRYRTSCSEARSMQLFFTEFLLPEGAQLHLYNNDYTRIYGAFTYRNNNFSNSLMIADFPGAEVIIEYFEPEDSEFDGSLVLGAIGKGYRSFKKALGSLDEDGYINVNCREGKDWQEQKHSVCRITYRSGGSGYLCSGALINNARNDGTPFFLTAYHCIENASSANTVVAYFNYENIGCDGPLMDELTLSGSSLKASSPLSDYSLLLLNNTPPAEYQPFYSGYDASGDTAEFSVGIHHPEGNPKKISIDESPPENIDGTISWVDGTPSPENSHWRVKFNRGRINRGSSGSPLYNEQGQITGQLHGGSEINDYYGKLSYSWNAPSGTGKFLKTFLDPDNENIRVMNGYYPPDNPPDPQFFPEFTKVCDSAGLILEGVSAFAPESWSWSFIPADVTFLDGTGPESAQPLVAFNELGAYKVGLEISNEGGTIKRDFTNVISVGSELAIEVETQALLDNCLCNFDSVSMIAFGAREYTWTLLGSDTLDFSLEAASKDKAQLKLLNLPAETVILEIEVAGKHGKCASELTYELALLNPSNDFVAGALEIVEGTNGPYSNECATIQEGEPVPPFKSCTGQMSWCDEYGTGEDIVENSVWFYFIPEDSGSYKLSSNGMDNQLALYYADSAEALLLGNYTLLGANDDFTTRNFEPIITEMILEKGKKYWIQTDGSAGGATGEFTINMEKVTTSIKDLRINGSALSVYPQPARERVYIVSPDFPGSGRFDIRIFTSSGRIVSMNTVNIHGSTIDLDVSGLKAGIYFVKIDSDSFSKTVRLIK